MNWLETVFGISPDGGNGVTELIVAVGVALAFAMAVLRRRHLVRLRRTKSKLG